MDQRHHTNAARAASLRRSSSKCWSCSQDSSRSVRGTPRHLTGCCGWRSRTFPRVLRTSMSTAVVTHGLWVRSPQSCPRLQLAWSSQFHHPQVSGACTVRCVSGGLFTCDVWYLCARVIVHVVHKLQHKNEVRVRTPHARAGTVADLRSRVMVCCVIRAARNDDRDRHHEPKVSACVLWRSRLGRSCGHLPGAYRAWLWVRCECLPVTMHCVPWPAGRPQLCTF